MGACGWADRFAVVVVATLASGASGPTVERVTEGLVVFYPFDEGTGTVVGDQSGVGTPLDLEIQSDTYEWSSAGLKWQGEGIIVAAGSSSKVRVACQATDEVTVEAWVTPGLEQQSGPARVVTFSLDTSFRHFTVGQGAIVEDSLSDQGWEARLLTTEKTGNGHPSLDLPEAPVTLEPMHLMFTRTGAGDEALWIDGTLEGTQQVGGTFENWDADSGYQFALGNELTLERPWVGEYHLVAVYDRALDPSEVQQNFDAGY